MVANNLIRLKIDKKEYFTTIKLYKTEKSIEKYCEELLDDKIDIPADYALLNLDDYLLQDEQKSAVDLIMNNNIGIITGSPGTGKTYIIGHACNQLRNHGQTIVLAPTGAAVEKLRYDINRLYRDRKFKNRPECSTRHSFLFSNMNGNRHDKKKQNKK